MAEMEVVDLTSDMTVRPEFTGPEPLLCPFAQHISTQRGNMFAANVAQALVLNGAEFPMISTGWEKQFGSYEFNPTNRKNDVQILAVIPKFQSHVGSEQIRGIPTYTFIYRDADTGEVDYFDRSTYTPLSHGFGYINKHVYTPSVGDLLLKEEVVSTSPNHHDDLYCQGVNANVAYMSAWETTEDAFIISDRLAKKMEHTAICKVRVTLGENDIPLNIYGAEDDYRIFPDIDEEVGDHGILIATRPLTEDTYLTDTDRTSLYTPQYMHDELFVAPAGATVLDVTVHTSPKVLNRIESNPGPYTQLIKYQQHHYQYYESVLRCYNKARKEGDRIGSKLGNLINTSQHLRRVRGGDDDRRSMQLSLNKNPIEFMTVEITYGYTRPVNRGSKISGRDGAKGVVSDIWALADMPTDADGHPADILISPDSPFNRMNPGQQYEQEINHFSEVIRKRFVDGQLGAPMDAYEYILGYLHDIRPPYAEFIRSQLTDEEAIMEFLIGVRNKGIYLIIPPFCETIGPQLIVDLSDKYNIDASPVTFTRRDDKGNGTTTTTKDNVCIGSKYVYLLGKIPRSMMSATQVGYVNQFKMPSKPNKSLSKGHLLYGQTPMRLGEDELCLGTMSMDANTIARIVGTMANSQQAVNEVTRHALTDEKPTTLRQIDMTTEEIIKSNGNVALFVHQMGAIGYDVGDTSIARDKRSV